ncbi:MAG: alpha-L-fucosidase [Chloroflexi bacterium]|nr:alpha-L-fucosidase [Chloroflexota bacterium]
MHDKKQFSLIRGASQKQIPISLFVISVLLLLLPGAALAISGGDGNPDLKTPQESLKRWRSLRVGAFIHWSPWVLHGLDTPNAFRAEQFDPKQWVQMFKEAGFKYVVFTTKHGDAVCMWDTKETDRNVINTPMKRDVVGELVAECNKQGVEFCPYYAVENFLHRDWTNNLDPKTGQPDYATRKTTRWSTNGLDPAAYHLQAGQKPDFERYVKHLKAQMKELTEKYGPFLAWWYDQRAPSWTHARGTDLYAYMRSIQPDVLVSHRIDTCYDRGLDNPTWFVTERKSAGDYAQSEISIPRFNRDIPWEYCRVAGIEGTTWYWKPNDVYRPLSEWIVDIVNSVCRDGNFLLGIGAMPDGRFEPRLVDQLRQLGLWLDRYGASIYGTRGGPFKPNAWYGSTCKGNNVYVHVFKTDSNATFTLPPIDKKVLRYRLMNGGAIDVKQTDKGIEVTIGKYDIQPTDTIVVLELDGSAEEITPVEERILTTGASVSASNVRENKKEYRPELTVDGNRGTYWTTDEGVTEGWLEYDLGKPCTFSRAILDEGEDGWIRHVQIQIKVGNEWKTGFEYRHGNPELWKKIPMELFCPEFKFPPVTAQLVRVKIISAIQSPAVGEFKIYER